MITYNRKMARLNPESFTHGASATMYWFKKAMIPVILARAVHLPEEVWLMNNKKKPPVAPAAFFVIRLV